MIINDVVIRFGDVLIASSMLLTLILTIIVMYYIPIIFGIFWAKAKGISPNIMWLMIFFYPGILALLVIRYLWINESMIKNSFFQIYYIDKEAYLEIKRNIEKILVKKNIIIGIVLLTIFSILLTTTGLYNGIRGDSLIKDSQLYKAKKYLINSVINTTINFDAKTDYYHKTMIICEELEDSNCQYKISEHMYKQEKTTPKANLYLAISSANSYNFKIALDYLEPVKYLYSNEYDNIENAYYEYRENRRIRKKENEKENELTKVKNSSYTVLNGLEDFIEDAIDSLSDFELKGTEEEIAEKVFLKFTAQGRVIGRIKTLAKVFKTYFNYSKIKRIKKLVIAKQLKALANQKNYYYHNKIYDYKKTQRIKNKAKFKKFKKCLDKDTKNCYKILEN